MIKNNSIELHSGYENLLVWVLAPFVQTNDENLDYYYDFSQSIGEYIKVFGELDLEWKWQPVTINDFKGIIEGIKAASSPKIPLVLNLCDGDELNGIPGISVIKALKVNGLPFTGSDEAFYEITTSKIPMKKCFEEGKVPTPKWKAVIDSEDLENIFTELKPPLIVKPAVSGGSMGVGVKSVVNNIDELRQQVAKLSAGYRGWDLATGGILAEEFIEGPEFTVLIVGSFEQPEKCIVYQPVERVFHNALPEKEKFLSFDRLWEIYEDETPIGEYEDFYNYFAPSVELEEEIKRISLDAFFAVKGTGYGRVDIRMDKSAGKMYVLEVNAQCGLSDDENFTSIGAILRLGNTNFTVLIKSILEDGLKRNYR